MMIECKDCLHNGVCYTQETCNDIEQQLKEFECNDFKDRSEWVHLPCKVGTVVYIPEFEFDTDKKDYMLKIHRTTVDEYSVNKKYVMYHTRKDNNFTDSMLGKTVFLNREEAEKALEEKK